MYLLLISLVLLMAAAVGWSIGANDAANSLGTAVGSRVVTLKQAIILIVIFGFLGAYLQGAYVTKTIGKGIVPINQLDKTLSLYLALVATFAACAWVVLATYWKMPISTSHSIVGAVAGAGMAIHAPVKFKILGDIFICWIFTPVGAAILGYIFYLIFKNIFYRIIPRKYVRVTLAMLIIISGCYVAYSWGANDVANATGVIAGAGVLSANVSVIFGGLAIVLGIMTWGYKVIETIGSEITHLLPLMAFSAQLASAINVHIYTVFGIPVSTSHSIVGAIFGVGLVRGVRVLNLRIMREIIICWLATPFVSGIISFLVLKGILTFVKI
ncbi:MAG: inorganic phosphate transporter [Candidatus Omnitrophica bacterium]|nr:inorganic phosphate transporter [Candidatus Omnitrophota bacterium]MDD5352158.1 inorganic phosphate transporter [Candidatus Omnitrophota bacterium]MDD5549756.1 inorganic phosphate transporter [Candidatus Omnitrophota bacterium]